MHKRSKTKAALVERLDQGPLFLVRLGPAFERALTTNHTNRRTADHFPRVKSGNFIGALPFATDASLNGPGADHAAASYTSLSGVNPSRMHCTRRYAIT